MITVAQFNDLVKNATVQWSKARGEFPTVRQMLANIKQVSAKTSEYSGISSAQTARRRTDGDDAYKGTLKQGYTKTFNQSEIALQFDITKQMRMFDKYDEIMKRMREMGRGAERRMELDLASLLFNAWATTYVNIDGETVTTATPDGLALIDNAHTAKTGATFSNEIATTHSPLDVDVLEKLEEVGNGFIDEADGRAIPCMFDTIITGRHAPTVHMVSRILNSELRQGTANNDVNTSKMYKHLIVPFLDVNPATEVRDSTKSKYVFLANLGNKDENGFVMEVSQDIRLETPEQVFENGAWQFQTTGLYDFGATRPAFISGTKGDGTAV